VAFIEILMPCIVRNVKRDLTLGQKSQRHRTALLQQAHGASHPQMLPHPVPLCLAVYIEHLVRRISRRPCAQRLGVAVEAGVRCGGVYLVDLLAAGSAVDGVAPAGMTV